MNKLSNRLKVVADYVDDNSKVIDIGCDHGLLSIYLVNNKKNIKVIASDINDNALSSARSNVKEYKLEDKIDIRLGKGLEVVSPEEIDTIVIAGMGSNTIVGILKYAKDKLKYVDNIIIQSNTDLYFLRNNITKLGYFIEDETLVEDKNIIYTVIKFKKGRKRYSYKELYLGPILINKKDKLFTKKYSKELNTLKMILKNITKGHYLYKMRIKRNIKIISETINLC